MGFKLFICVIAVIILLSSPTFAQNVNLQCTFQVSGGDYDCIINMAVVGNNENSVITFIGNHAPGQSHNTVTRLLISGSNIGFIIRQAFTSFPILRVYSNINAQVNPVRLQANAFQGANSLQEITILNSQLAAIDATSLQGAINVRWLNLQNNMLTSLPTGLLDTMANLDSINLSNNLFASLHDNIFSRATALTSINLSNNQLTRLPGSLLNTNTRLNQFVASFNQIQAINRRFLDGLNALVVLNLSGNVCTSGNWNNIGTGTTLDAVRTALELCFNNYGGNVEARNFTMDLRGHLTLFREDGTLVGRI